MITVKVGEADQDVFMLPEDRLRASSEFIDAAMRGPWKESQERMVSLPNFDRKLFAVYLQWLLTGVVHSRQRGDDPLSALLQELVKLPELFNLGHYLLDTDFRDALNDSLMQCVIELQGRSAVFSPSYGSKFYQNVPDGSPTRKLITDIIVWGNRGAALRALPAKIDTMEPDLIMDLLLAVTGRYVSLKPDKYPFDKWQTSCKYHCHGDEKVCYRQKASTYVTSFTGDLTATERE